MHKLSDTAATALQACYATRGKHKGQLLARCPNSYTLAAAAWQGAMMSCNPFKASIAAALFMSTEQKAVYHEVMNAFDAMPRAERIKAERNRQALEAWGVW
jgi:hypothetical protein